MCPSCSQNAHIQKVLVRYAQKRATLATPLERSVENCDVLAPPSREQEKNMEEIAEGTRRT